jgi:hypothetical protein
LEVQSDVLSKFSTGGFDFTNPAALWTLDFVPARPEEAIADTGAAESIAEADIAACVVLAMRLAAQIIGQKRRKTRMLPL